MYNFSRESAIDLNYAGGQVDMTKDIKEYIMQTLRVATNTALSTMITTTSTTTLSLSELDQNSRVCLVPIRYH